MRGVIFLLFLFATFVQSASQAAGVVREVRKTLRNARYYDNANEANKVAESLINSEKMLLEAITSEVRNKKKADYYYLAALVQEKANDIENAKVYLSLPYDTLKYYESICKMYEYLNKCDSVAALTANNNRYRNDAQKKMMYHRQNLLNGGRYYLMNKKNNEAFRIFDLYLISSSYPALKQLKQQESDSMYSKVAYWAVLSSFPIHKYDKVIHYTPTALTYGKNKQFIQEYLCRSYKAINKENEWLSELKKGLRQYPEHPYFFTTLISHFSNNKQYGEALLYADKMTEYAPTNITYWYAKVQIYLCMADYEECIKACDKVIALDSLMTAAYYYKGLSYCNMAKQQIDAMRDIPVKSKKYEALKDKMLTYYALAEEPLLVVKMQKPEEKEAWAPLLYQVYLNLNKGEQFDEMDKILKSMTTVPN